MAHPDIQRQHAVSVNVVFDAVEQAGLADHIHAGIAEFAQVGTFDLATQLLGHGLHAVADAEQRYVQIKYRLRCTRAVSCVDRLRATGQDDAARCKGVDVLGTHVPGVDLAVNTDLTHPAGDELGVLGAEVQNQDAVRMDILQGHGISSEKNKAER